MTATHSDAPDWRDALARCGLQVIGDTVQQGITAVQTAIYAVTGVDVEPVATVSVSDPRAADELDRQWHQYASSSSLYAEDGEFLILPPVSGGSTVGWVRVKDPIGNRLPSRISETTGSPEFLAVSADGRHLCATSVEDDDYWVVVHEFA
jgi:hypothetical protein